MMLLIDDSEGIDNFDSGDKDDDHDL